MVHRISGQRQTVSGVFGSRHQILYPTFRIQWSAEVAEVSGKLAENSFHVGDTITASGLFDNPSTVMHAYYPASTIIETHYTTDIPGVFDIFDDVLYNFSPNLQVFINGTDQTYTKIFLSQYSHDVVSGTGVGAHKLQYRDPGIEIVFSGNPGISGNWGWINVP